MSLELPRGAQNLLHDFSKKGFGDKYNLLGKFDGKGMTLERRHAKGIQALESMFINDTDRLNAAEYLTRFFIDYAGDIENDQTLDKNVILENLDIFRARMVEQMNPESKTPLARKMEEAFVAVKDPVIPTSTLRVFQDFSEAALSNTSLIYGEKVGNAYRLKYAKRGTFRARLIADHERLQASRFVKEAALKYAKYFKEHDHILVEGRLVNRFNMVKNLETMRFRMVNATRNERHKQDIYDNMTEAIKALKPEVIKAKVPEQNRLLNKYAQNFIYRLESAGSYILKTDPNKSLEELREVFTAIMNDNAKFRKPKTLAHNLSVIRVDLVMREEALLAKLAKDPQTNATTINDVINRIAAINFAINQIVEKLHKIEGEGMEKRLNVALPPSLVH